MLVHARGVVVALPHIVEGEMQARRYEPGDRMTETSFGALEPSDGAPIDPGAIDVIATPAVAFDRLGARVGYGGGFYDRFFPRTRGDCLRAGVGFGVQVLALGDELPGGHFDLKVDLDRDRIRDDPMSSRPLAPSSPDRSGVAFLATR